MTAAGADVYVLAVAEEVAEALVAAVPDAPLAGVVVVPSEPVATVARHART